MKEVPLSELLSALESGARPKGGASADTGEIPSLGGEHLDDEGGFKFESIKRIPTDFYARLKGGRIAKGDILIVKDGATTGKTSFVDARFPFDHAAVNEHVFRMALDTKQVHSKYAFYFLSSRFGKAQILSDFRGATVGGIGRTFIDRVKIPLPPLPEQRRIADVLDLANELRTKRRLSISNVTLLAQSLFDQLFKHPESTTWRSQPLTEIFNFRTGKLDSNAATPDGPYPFFTCSRETFRIDTYAFDCEALLLAGNNANADYSVKHYKGKFNAYQRTYVITLKNTANSYEYARMALERKLADLKRYSKGTNTKYLTMGIFDQLSLLVPPPFVQNQFARSLQTCDELRDRSTRSLAALNALFASLQERAFQGGL